MGKKQASDCMRRECRQDESRSRRWDRRSFLPVVIVLVGIALGQAILFGPSLAGRKILLPLDYLANPGIYLPRSIETAKIHPHNYVLSDLVLLGEQNRWFAVPEILSGRWPVWTPYQFGGSPLVAHAKYSPFGFLGSCVKSPVILAWCELLLAVTTGLGAYVFSRRTLKVATWPAILVAWCWPLSGYFIFWQGYNGSFVVGWLPWLLWATDDTVRRTSRWGGLALAATTCLVLTAGQLDVSGQVLVVSGFYALWCCIDEYGDRRLKSHAPRALIAVVAGWLLGFLLASPYWLPLLEYSHTGSRMARRSQGEEERPPVGMAALPQIVLPDMYGSTQEGSFPMFPPGEGNQLESSSTAYAGLLATLFLAPLAWCSRRHRSVCIFWLVVGFLGLSWCLNVPGVVDVMRWPGLNMLSHNRFVFVTSFAILVMMAIGLDVLWNADVRWRPWFWLPIGLLLLLLLWSLYRAIVLPEPIATQLGRAVLQGQQPMGIANLTAVRQVQMGFTRNYAVAALLSTLGILGWLSLGVWARWRRWLLPAISVLLLADLLWFAHGRSAQCDPSLYYPRIPALEAVSKAEPGRIVGYHCLPAILGQTHHLHDIRGYDAVDPARWVELLEIARDPRGSSLPYALTQWFLPKISTTPAGAIRLSPILDMLNVRYVIFRGSPPPDIQPDFASPDYWVKINENAQPRVFVPSRVETLADDKQRLARLSASDFDPRRTAYVEQPVDLPQDGRGAVEIVDEIPTRVTVSCNLDTPGLVVLADRWDKGWNAYWDGKPVPILRTNHAIRGVVVPAGKGTLEFRYEPASVAWGWRLCGLAIVALAGWTWFARRRNAPCSDIQTS